MKLCGLAGLALTVALNPNPALDVLLARFDAYIDRYETELGSVVADERFVQETPPLTSAGARPDVVRRLISEVAFLRLPNDAEWMGFRRVQRVDGRRVTDTESSLASLLGVATDDRLGRARLLVMLGASHHLGAPRTINMPNLPLDLLQRRHRSRFDVSLEGNDRIAGRAIRRVRFVERAAPSIVTMDNRRDLLSRVRAWIDADDGTLHRAEVTFDAMPPLRGRPRVDVRFKPDPSLGIFVPVEMHEDFLVEGRGTGKGRATYTNYRRFQTSARIVPQ